jgi:RNA polymerase sigma-70 factor (ECF subfamily)
MLGEPKTNEEQAFELLFRRYYVRLCGFANKFLANSSESEEIVQEVFLSIWKKKDQLKFDDQIRPYLFKSVQNLCYNFLEHKKVVNSYYSVIELVYKNQSNDFNTYESVLYSEFQQRVEQGINSLPEQCRLIFNLSRQEGLKYAEIAERLGISVKTVETQMSRALSKLKVELKDYLVVLIVSLFLNSN